ncbi:MAG: hypothetical protein HQM04_04730 [Magnetococcales bacterium]|nr:hypothetical protein [Magnetococcales bacterium]MBF0114330.1 hypothetical protein [Magnetococcales bacterium]
MFIWIYSDLSVAASTHIVVIGHPGLPKLDVPTIQKLFTGRAVEINGRSVTVVNIAPNNTVRKVFLEKYLEQDEDKYLAYWTVRRFIGKGTPPKELVSSTEVVEYIQSHSDTIGYISVDDSKPGLNILSEM